MIIGIGTDIVQIPRIERILDLYKDHFINRLLCEVELQKLALLDPSKHANFLAKRFAAKEAISKALGTGIGPNLQFKNIIILNDDLGKPFVQITSHKLNQFQIHLSLSDDYPISIAFAIITSS